MSNELIESLRYLANRPPYSGAADIMLRAADALEAKAAPVGERESVTVLPDGSAFGVMSFPLPKDHWLYAEREYEDGADQPKELPAPILNHGFRGIVEAAVRYAVRGATNCGKEPDFDPDALVQNAVYALCGPFGGAAYLRSQQPQSAEAVAWAAQNVSSGKYGYIWHEESDVRGWINLQHQSDNSTWRGPIALYTTPQPSAGVVMPDWLDSYSAMAERLLKAGWKDSGDAQWAGIAEMHNEFARLNGEETAL